MKHIVNTLLLIFFASSILGQDILEDIKNNSHKILLVSKKMGNEEKGLMIRKPEKKVYLGLFDFKKEDIKQVYNCFNLIKIMKEDPENALYANIILYFLFDRTVDLLPDIILNEEYFLLFKDEEIKYWENFCNSNIKQTCP
jgi:hypothetical protein